MFGMDDTYKRAERQFKELNSQINWLSGFEGISGTYAEGAVKARDSLITAKTIEEQIPTAGLILLEKLENESGDISLKKVKNDVKDKIASRKNELTSKYEELEKQKKEKVEKDKEDLEAKKAKELERAKSEDIRKARNARKNLQKMEDREARLAAERQRYDERKLAEQIEIAKDEAREEELAQAVIERRKELERQREERT